MKIKEGFILHPMGQEYIAAAVGDAAQQFSGMIRLNEAGAFLWHMLEQGASRAQLTEALCDRYEGAEAAQVAEDVDEFLSILRPALYDDVHDA